MEAKDWIYTIGILLTFSVSVLSLYINWINRRNGAREHLYKEQFEFYKKLINQSLEMLALFNQIRMKQIPSEANVSVISNEIMEIHKLTMKNSFLIPNQLETQLRKTIEESWNCYTILSEKGYLDETDTDSVSLAYSDLMNWIRNEIGADELSDENKRLFGSVIIKSEPSTTQA